MKERDERNMQHNRKRNEVKDESISKRREEKRRGEERQRGGGHTLQQL